MNQTEFTQDEYEVMKKDFIKINKNYLELEYQNKKDSSFTKILDYSLKGKKRFHGLFPDDCFENI